MENATIPTTSSLVDDSLLIDPHLLSILGYQTIGKCVFNEKDAH